jgi:hypothetical protein
MDKRFWQLSTLIHEENAAAVVFKPVARPESFLVHVLGALALVPLRQTGKLFDDSVLMYAIPSFSVGVCPRFLRKR